MCTNRYTNYFECVQTDTVGKIECVQTDTVGKVKYVQTDTANT